MQYYAKTYTADPKTGLLSPGEYLTEEQVAALGEERIANMVERGILAVTGGKPAQTEENAESEKPAAKKPAKKAKAAAEEPEADADPEEDEEGGDLNGEKGDADPEEDEEGGDLNGEEGDGELPELDAADAIGEEEKPAEEPAKKGGRRKTK